MTRVLAVEDEPPLVRALEINLKARGYDVETAPDGAHALRRAAARPPDVVLLDLGLPDMDGIDVIKELRGWSRASILVVSARRTSQEKVTALDAGADDYITKPFDMDELLARLRAAARRAEAGKPAVGTAVIETEGFTIDLLAKKARREGRDIRLTPTEWHLLEVLIRNSGRLVGQQQLLQEVWGPSHSTQTNYLRVYMAQLRRKLEADPAHPRHFFTAPGMGYRFDP
ncbi:response regulator [Streptomyces sp. NRRL S-1813]|uniref:response regulator n=1 Tax=Streptomyces sp. NRRL S-1813 TaxID=1463888 RepID=UPI0004CB23C2|nr:response regulator transcription factor [Streptomyces sp. NRRL S-1813]